MRTLGHPTARAAIQRVGAQLDIRRRRRGHCDRLERRPALLGVTCSVGRPRARIADAARVARRGHVLAAACDEATASPARAAGGDAAPRPRRPAQPRAGHEVGRVVRHLVGRVHDAVGDGLGARLRDVAEHLGARLHGLGARLHGLGARLRDVDRRRRHVARRVGESPRRLTHNLRHARPLAHRVRRRRHEGLDLALDDDLL
eukprot:2634987-Prymnesium_polylepis.1